jgi:hypothetical protein
MAKAKKPAKEASNIFHNIMQASVKGSPKPIKKATPIEDSQSTYKKYVEGTEEFNKQSKADKIPLEPHLKRLKNNWMDTVNSSKPAPKKKFTPKKK